MVKNHRVYQRAVSKVRRALDSMPARDGSPGTGNWEARVTPSEAVALLRAGASTPARSTDGVPSDVDERWDLLCDSIRLMGQQGRGGLVDLVFQPKGRLLLDLNRPYVPRDPRSDDDISMTTAHGHRVCLEVGPGWARMVTTDPMVWVGALLPGDDALPRVVADLGERLHARIVARRALRDRFAHQVAREWGLSVRSIKRRLSAMHGGRVRQW